MRGFHAEGTEPVDIKCAYEVTKSSKTETLRGETMRGIRTGPEPETSNLKLEFDMML